MTPFSRLRRSALVALWCIASLVGFVAAHAGTYTQDFSTFVVGGVPFGDGSTLTSTLLGPAGKIEDPTLKELQLSQWDVPNTRAAFLLPDLDPGTPLHSFSARWVSPVYADLPDAGAGFSFNFGPLGGLALAAEEYDPESGYGVGLCISMKTSGPDAGFRLLENGIVLASAPHDPAVVWGNFSGTRHRFEVIWNRDHGLSLTLDGGVIFSDVPTPAFIPAAGDRIAWAARSGSTGQTFRVDNLSVTTYLSITPYTRNFDGLSNGTTTLDDGSILFGPAAGIQDGELELSAKDVLNTRTALLLPDLSPTARIRGFSASWTSPVFGDFPDAGEGFSFNFGPLGSTNLVGGSTLQELGYGVGLCLSVATGPSFPGIRLLVNNVRVAGPVHINPTAIWGTLSPVRHTFNVVWTERDGVTVIMDGTTLFAKVPVPNFSSAWGDRLVWAARNGPRGQTVRLDDLQIVTAPPVIESPAVSDVSPAGQMTATATVNTRGLPTTFFVELGTTTHYGTVVSTPIEPPKDGLSPFSFTYKYDPGRNVPLHARITVSNALGTVTSPDMVFASPDFLTLFTQLPYEYSVSGALAWLDSDDDGWLDFNVSGRLPDVYYSRGHLLYNPGAGGGEWKPILSPDGFRPGIAVGDLDNDNRADAFFLNGREIEYARPTATTFPIGSASAILHGGERYETWGELVRSTNFYGIPDLYKIRAYAAIADLDRDGKSDVMINGMDGMYPNRHIYADMQSWILRNMFDGTRTTNAYGGTRTNVSLVPMISEIPDLAVWYSGGAWGVGTYGQGGFVVGDLNGDGHQDVFIFNPLLGPVIHGFPFIDNKVEVPKKSFAAVYMGDGDFGFTQKGTYLMADEIIWANAEVCSMALADFDGDGSLDLLISHLNGHGPDSAIRIWLNDGQGNFSESGFVLPQLPLANVAVGDIFNHGRNDIVLSGMTEAVLLRNDGGGVFTPFPLPGIGGSSETGTGLQVADYDNDGRLDFALCGNLAPEGIYIIPNPVVTLARNELDIPANMPPEAPLHPGTSVAPGSVTFHWDRATDDFTPSNQLSYNLRVGTQPMGTDAVSPLADVVTGWRKIVGPGNCGSSTNITYRLAPGTYYWSVQAVDGGFKGGAWAAEGSFVIPEVETPRLEWQIGTDDNPLVLPYRPRAEFSQENNRNDVGPGRVTRVPGDPQYEAGSNPGADDDFYFAGNYPVGFNGLLAPLSVLQDEPPIAWERAHTVNDRTNRVHFVLTPAQVTAASSFQLSFELVHGGSLMGGVVQPGFGDHDLVVNFRNAAGVTTQLFSQRVSQATHLVIPFAASTVGAMAGANTLEIVRTGPAVSGVFYWIQYDYLRLESWPTGNTAPTLTQPSDQVVDEGVLLTFALSAVDADVPAQTLTYSRVSGPEGLTVSPEGLVTWTPREAQGPGTYAVEVRVTDSGYPTQSDTRQFSVQVNEVADPVLRTVWQIGIDNNPAVSPYRPTAEFSQENNRNDLRPGKVTRLTGDPQYIAASNPTADDDFYFAGVYPPGFNGLAAPLSVPNDEPSGAWERAQTGNDRTNRMHFTLGAGQVGAESRYRFRFELVFGGSSVGGVVQPGFGSHDMVVRFRNSTGASTELFAQRVTQSTNVVIEFTAASVGALEGANSIEIVRTGPVVAGTSYWINNDYLLLENLSVGPGPTGGLTLSRVDADPLAADRDAAAAVTAVPGVARLGLAMQEGGEYLTLTYEEPYPAPSGVRYQVEGSSDLVRWSAEGITPVSDEVQSGTRTVTVRDAYPVGASPNRFLRVRRVASDRE